MAERGSQIAVVVLLAAACVAGVARGDSALGLCDFYANQPILSQKILKGKGWRCTQRADGSWGGEDPCTWPKRSGIVCDGGQTVTAIKINCEAWKRTLGGLLSPFLADYKSVTQMQIRGCGLTGSVPLSLYYRREFSSMQTLDLSGNRLTGQLPAVLEWGASSLRVINLSGNLFSGPLPERWALNLVNLEVLDLSNNAFSGGFPALWGSADAKWPTSIRISICGTGVKGPLPPSMTSGNLRLFATRSPTTMCGRLPAPMLDRGTPAGIYPCGLFTNEPLNWGTVPLNWKYRQDQMPQCAA